MVSICVIVCLGVGESLLLSYLHLSGDSFSTPSLQTGASLSLPLSLSLSPSLALCLGSGSGDINLRRISLIR